MLPGFKLLFATVILSVSVLIFGLGAAALLRSAHDDFVSMPSWRLAQQPLFIPAGEASRPTLSMLRAEPPAIAEAPAKTEPKAEAKIEAKADLNVDAKTSDSKNADTTQVEDKNSDAKNSDTKVTDTKTDIKSSETKPGSDKIASLDPQATTDATADIAQPAKPKFRKSKRARARAINQRRKAIVRTRAPRTVEQQPAQVFPALFSGS